MPSCEVVASQRFFQRQIAVELGTILTGRAYARCLYGQNGFVVGDIHWIDDPGEWRCLMAMPDGSLALVSVLLSYPVAAGEETAILVKRGGC